MARKTREESLQTREKLLDAALEIFWEEGVARPSLTRVAERAGMTRGAVYGHFKNKADLLGAICDRHLLPADVLEQIRQNGDTDPLKTLHDWIVSIFQRTTSDPQHHQLMGILFLKCEAVEGDLVRDRFLQDAAVVRRHERALLERAVQRGQLSADLDLDLASFLINAFIAGALRTIALHGDILSPAHFEQIGQAALDMLRSPNLDRRTAP